MHVFVCALCIYVFIYLRVYLFNGLFIYARIYLCVYVFVC